jgi:site-specific recombinase XerD
MRVPTRPRSTPCDALGRVTSVTEAERYQTTLRARHLSATTIDRYLEAVTHFAQWRTTPAATRSESLSDDVMTFLGVHLPHCTCPCGGRRAVIENRAALKHWVRATTTGTVPLPTTPVDVEIRAYDTYLKDTCGAAVHTRLHRTRHVRAFLTALFGDQPVWYESIGPATLTAFLTTRAQHVKPGTAGVIASGLRSYLRYLALQGVAVDGLCDAIPRVAGWRLASIPQHLSADDLSRFLASFDRRTPRSHRDYAMAVCLTTWGLRASEVAGLRIADIDWRAATATIRESKTHRPRALPLTRVVGDAVVRYLRVRPSTTTDHVFVHLGVREGEPILPSVVRSAVRQGYRRAGLPARFTGTHRLRHTVATRLINTGASLKEVADLLGHASLDATAIYAKVDLSRLRHVALPWPEVSR